MILADGFIRFNLRGRESRGLVEKGDAGALADRLTRLLRGLSDGRTGKPAVREGAPASAVSGGLADLVVAWSKTPIDAVVSPEHGRIGPPPYRQAGGHTARGFICVSGDDATARELPPGRLVDIAPTILDLMGVARPNHLAGVSLGSRQ